MLPGCAGTRHCMRCSASSGFQLTTRSATCFAAFTMGHVQRLFEPLKCWELERLPQRHEGYSLDLDSTVFERYGEQEGSLKGHNPRKHGRPSHHPLLAAPIFGVEPIDLNGERGRNRTF